MCGVIVVDAGRSRSTNLGRDAYVMIIGYCHNYLKFYQFPNNNLFTHHLLFFSREATSETYGPRVLFLIYLPLRSTLSLLLFSDLLNQKSKNTLLQFILSRVPPRSIYQIITTFSRPFANFWRRYPKGIDNPFNTSGCEYLLFVCRCRLRIVAWFSYWFDNLCLIIEGNTYRRCAASSLPLWGNTDVV